MILHRVYFLFCSLGSPGLVMQAFQGQEIVSTFKKETGQKILPMSTFEKVIP